MRDNVWLRWRMKGQSKGATIKKDRPALTGFDRPYLLWSRYLLYFAELARRQRPGHVLKRTPASGEHISRMQAVFVESGPYTYVIIAIANRRTVRMSLCLHRVTPPSPHPPPRRISDIKEPLPAIPSHRSTALHLTTAPPIPLGNITFTCDVLLQTDSGRPPRHHPHQRCPGARPVDRIAMLRNFHPAPPSPAQTVEQQGQLSAR